MSSAKVAAILPGLNVLINSMAGKASSQDISSRRIGLVLLTHWGRDKMATIFQTMFLNEFSWMKMYVFWLNFHWNLLARDQLTSTMVHIMAWRRPGNKPLSEPMMVNLLTDIWVTRPQWAKETLVKLESKFYIQKKVFIVWNCPPFSSSLNELNFTSIQYHLIICMCVFWFCFSNHYH